MATRANWRAGGIAAALAAVVLAAPAAGQATGTGDGYRAGRRGTFYSSGFLTENQAMPFGQLLGGVVPQETMATYDWTSVWVGSTVAITPPTQDAYRVGDSLLVVRLGRNYPGFGRVVLPVGIVRVTGASAGKTLAVVQGIFNEPARPMYTMPVEAYAEPAQATPVPVVDGVRGRVIGTREANPLLSTLDVVFFDVGRRDGVRVGDIFEARRVPSDRPSSPVAGRERMAVFEVVHVRDRTATARVVSVSAPNVPAGTEVVQLDRLPS